MDPEFLTVSPEEAVRSFRAKGYHVGFDWRDTDAQEHLRSFTVAKAMRLDLLEDIRGGVDRALADGTTFETFRDELEPLLRRKGWWGRQEMRDPVTGEVRTVQLGSTRRLRIIFDTNLRMSYARGRWERIERVAEARPWLRYVGVLDEKIRPQHRAWHGTVLPWDHPWWRTHYPPNGWRCRCTVQQLSDDDLEAFGYQPSAGPPQEGVRPWTNERTGRVYQVPAGIDPGFQFNPGLIDAGKDAADRLAAKIDATGPELSAAAIGRPWRLPLFRQFLQGQTDGQWHVGVAGASILDAIGGKSRTVRLSSDMAAKQARQHGDIRADDYALVQRILDDGEMFEGGARRAVGFLDVDGQLWRAAVKATRDGSETYLVNFHRAQPHNLDRARRALDPIVR